MKLIVIYRADHGETLISAHIIESDLSTNELSSIWCQALEGVLAEKLGIKTFKPESDLFDFVEFTDTAPPAVSFKVELAKLRLKG